MCGPGRSGVWQLFHCCAAILRDFFHKVQTDFEYQLMGPIRDLPGSATITPNSEEEAAG